MELFKELIEKMSFWSCLKKRIVDKSLEIIIMAQARSQEGVVPLQKILSRALAAVQIFS